MEDNFKFLKDAFDKFARKYKDNDNVSSGLIRSAAAGGKAAVDRGMQEFPKEFISEAAQDLYDILTSQEIADGISANVRAFDEEKIKGLLDAMLAPFKDPATATEFVRQMRQNLTDPDAMVAQYEKLFENRSEMEKRIVHELLEKFLRPQLEQTKDMSFDDYMVQIEGMISSIPGLDKYAPMIFIQIRPILEGMKDASDEEIAERLAELADMVPTDTIAQLAASYTRQVTPERLSKQAHDIVGKLPSPQAVADIVHGIGGELSSQFDRATKITAPGELNAITQEFSNNAKGIVSEILQNDKDAKNTFDKKKGDSFDL